MPTGSPQPRLRRRLHPFSPRRWRLYVIAALALLLCLASSFLWWRSFRWVDICDYEVTQDYLSTTKAYTFKLGQGYLIFDTSSPDFSPADDETWLYHSHSWNWEVEPARYTAGYRWPDFYTGLWKRQDLSFLGFHVLLDWRLPGVALPFWFLTAAPAALGLWLAAKLWKTRAPGQAGLCPICAYDLRAHAPGQKCPECGTTIPCEVPRECHESPKQA